LNGREIIPAEKSVKLHLGYRKKPNTTPYNVLQSDWMSVKRQVEVTPRRV